jgi:hypothetical protein
MKRVKSFYPDILDSTAAVQEKLKVLVPPP